MSESQGGKDWYVDLLGPQFWMNCVLLSLPGRSAFFLCQFFGSLIQNFVFQWRITMSLFFFWFLQGMSTNFRNQINKCFHKNTLYWTMGNQLSNEFCNEIYCYINVSRQKGQLLSVYIQAPVPWLPTWTPTCVYICPCERRSLCTACPQLYTIVWCLLHGGFPWPQIHQRVVRVN